MKKKIAVVIPAHNEETTISVTIKSLLNILSKDDIYLVSDGSNDHTVNIAKRYISNVLDLFPNAGKAGAINNLVTNFRLSERYQYVMTIDADTQVRPNFIKEAFNVLDNDKKHDIACLAGKVIGRKLNWLTYYRLWEYEVFQTIHKTAQTIENAVTVCPGCGTVYRSEVLKKILIPSDTITEDMDFTLSIHRGNLGKIVFCPKAEVVTQDPKNLSDFLKQVDRWYTGFWQCLHKHQIPWGGQPIDFELGMLGFEGLFSSLLYITVLLFSPFYFNKAPYIFLIPFLTDLLFYIPTMAATARACNAWKIFIYFPHFYLLKLLSNFIFLKCFIKVVFSYDSKMKWHKSNRYKII